MKKRLHFYRTVNDEKVKVYCVCVVSDCLTSGKNLTRLACGSSGFILCPKHYALAVYQIDAVMVKI